jgi:hypothetical protein
MAITRRDLLRRVASLAVGTLTVPPILLKMFQGTACAAGTIYYVSNNGSDSAGGTSQASAWRTVSKVNSVSYAPGDRILFERGSIWREVLNPPSSGLSGNPIIYGAYGSGNLPEIRGTTLVTNWTNTSRNVWSATLAGGKPAKFVWDRSDTRLTNRRTSLGAVVNAGDWFHNTDMNLLYVYSTSNPTSVEAAVESSIVVLFGNQGFLTFDSLHFTRASGQVVFMTSCNAIVRQNCMWSWLYFQDMAYGGGTPSNLSVISCIAHDCGGAGITFPNSIAGANVIRGNEVYRCCFLHDAGVGEHDSAGAIKVFGPSGGTVVIEDNHVHDIDQSAFAGSNSGNGIWVDTWSDAKAIVRGNRVHDCSHAGIFLEFGGGWLCCRNQVYRCGKRAVNANRGWFSGIGQYRSHACMIYHNTIYDCQWGYSTEGGSNPGEWGGSNDLANNILVGNVMNFQTGKGQGEETTILRKNCFGPEFKNFMDLEFTDYDTYALFETAYGASTISVEANPLLKDPANGDLTLQATSPCRNVGALLPGINDDYKGSAPDIGWYEFLESTDTVPPGRITTLTVR